jgi:hypothetical protein
MNTTDNPIGNGLENGGKRRTFVKQRRNQLIYTVYEYPKENGHIMTAKDSYRNVLGRIMERYDTEKNQFEYVFIDPDGNELFKSNELEKLKQQISKNKEILMQMAYDRRLEKIRAMRAQREQGKQNEREHKMPGKLKEKDGISIVITSRKGKIEELKFPQEFTRQVFQGRWGELGDAAEWEKAHQEWQREQELHDLRNRKNRGRGQELSR